MIRPEPRLSCSLLLVFAAVFAVSGCSRSKPKKTTPITTAKCASAPAVEAKLPEKIVLDYRWGWYHPATGRQTIAQVAAEYRREPELLAKLNQSEPAARPVAGKMLYIPPNNNREYIRKALIKINENPEIVPRTPWHPDNLKTVGPIEIKQTEHALKTKLQAASLKETVRTEIEKPRIVEAKLPANIVQARMVASAAISDVDPVMDAPKAGKPVSAAGAATGPGGFAWPLEGKVVTPFSEGWRKACHGIEIEATEGTPVSASRGGKVLLAQQFPGYGNLILIDHGDGFASVYGYLQSMKAREGGRVQRGDVIGASGAKNSSPLLFFQIRRKGVKVDPMEYLP